MDEKVKHRMIGAAVFFTLAVIFVPMLFEESLKPEDQPALQQVTIPKQPEPLESQIISQNPNTRNQQSTAGQQPLTQPSRPTIFGTVPIELPQAQGITAVKVDSETKPASAKQGKLNPVPNHAWMVQVGSFGSEVNAHGLANELKKAGFKAFVERIQGSNNTPLYRVAIGPESGRQSVEVIRNRLQQQLGMKTLIRPYVQ